MKLKNILSAALALGLFAAIGFGGTAEAFPGNRGYGYHGGGMMTQEQQSATREISLQHQQAVAPLYQELDSKRAELDALSYAKNPNSSQVQGLYKEIADLEAKLFSINADFRSKYAAQGVNYPAGYGRGYGYHQGGYGYHQGYGRHGGGRNHGGPAGYGRGGCYGGYW